MADHEATVTAIPLAPKGAPNYQCRRCGGEWFASVIVLDGYDRAPTGYSIGHTACHDCGLPIPSAP